MQKFVKSFLYRNLGIFFDQEIQVKHLDKGLFGIEI